jgi:hypothetical protein
MHHSICLITILVLSLGCDNVPPTAACAAVIDLGFVDCQIVRNYTLNPCGSRHSGGFKVRANRDRAMYILDVCCSQSHGCMVGLSS